MRRKRNLYMSPCNISGKKLIKNSLILIRRNIFKNVLKHALGHMNKFYERTERTYFIINERL